MEGLFKQKKNFFFFSFFCIFSPKGIKKEPVPAFKHASSHPQKICPAPTAPKPKDGWYPRRFRRQWEQREDGPGCQT